MSCTSPKNQGIVFYAVSLSQRRSARFLRLTPGSAVRFLTSLSVSALFIGLHLGCKRDAEQPPPATQPYAMGGVGVVPFVPTTTMYSGRNNNVTANQGNNGNISTPPPLPGSLSPGSASIGQSGPTTKSAVQHKSNRQTLNSSQANSQPLSTQQWLKAYHQNVGNTGAAANVSQAAVPNGVQVLNSSDTTTVATYGSGMALVAQNAPGLVDKIPHFIKEWGPFTNEFAAVLENSVLPGAYSGLAKLPIDTIALASICLGVVDATAKYGKDVGFKVGLTTLAMSFIFPSMLIEGAVHLVPKVLPEGAARLMRTKGGKFAIGVGVIYLIETAMKMMNDYHINSSKDYYAQQQKMGYSKQQAQVNLARKVFGDDLVKNSLAVRGQ